MNQLPLFSWIFLLLFLAMFAVACSTSLRARMGKIVPHGGGITAFVGQHYTLILLCVFALAIFVRVWQFNVWPQGMYYEEAMLAQEGYSLALYGEDRYGTAWPVYLWGYGFGQQAALYSYMCAPLMKVFGMSRFVFRLPMLLLHLAMLPVFWDFSRRLLGKNFALLALFLLAINPYFFMTSHWTMECNVFGHLLLLGIYLLCVGEKRRWALYLAMVVFGLSMYAYGISIYVVPIVLISAAVYLLKSKKAKWMDILLCIPTYLFFAFPFILTMAINAFGWDTMQLGPFTIQNFYENDRASDIALFSPVPMRSVLENLIIFVNVTFLQAMDTVLTSSLPPFRTMYAFSVVPMLAGVVCFVRDVRAKKITATAGALTMCLFCALVVGAALTERPAIHRSNGVFYLLLIFCAYGIYKLVKRVRVFLPVVLLMYIVAFGALMTGYDDAAQTERLNAVFSGDMYDAQCFVKEKLPYEFDTFYVLTLREDPAEWAQLLNVTQKLNARQVRGEEEVLREDGSVVGMAYEVYRHEWAQEFYPDASECAVYAVPAPYVERFPEGEYLHYAFAEYTVCYPVYWAED